MATLTEETYTAPNGSTYAIARIDNDINGNPRYLVHFLDLGLNDQESNALTKSVGLKKFTGKIYGGGFVFQSFNLHDAVKRFEQEGLTSKK